MNLKAKFLFFISFISVIGSADEGFCASRLTPQDFNRMYYIASLGRVDILRNAVNRGMNINTVNQNGDTGLCIAIKRNNHVAFESFRRAGANVKHPCTNKIRTQYAAFMGRQNSKQQIEANKKYKSLYYPEEENKLLPWVLGGLALGGGALAFSGGGGGYAPSGDNGENITPVVAGDGLGTLLINYKKSIIDGQGVNGLDIDVRNSLPQSNINSIQMIPNMLDNFSNLYSYAVAKNGAGYINKGILSLYDGTIGLSATGNQSNVTNNNKIDINSVNGSIGLVASNGSIASNGRDKNDSSTINITYKGTKAGAAVIGMYADTNSTIENYGTIFGSTVSIPVSNAGGKSGIGLLATEEVLEEEGTEEEETEEKEEEKPVINANSGTILGMGVFDFYTGTNFSSQVIRALNYGEINLSAGYNDSTDASVSLIGMGSFLDDNFLYGTSNPNFAEQMILNNMGDIKLSYQGKYLLADNALKLGDGGLIGIRADGSTDALNNGSINDALNNGSINIDLRATNLPQNIDVAAGMLSVHGADLTNNGEITILNAADSGGVTYGMVATTGDGSQTRVYKFKEPLVKNDGTINMHVSNSYGMASFAGGNVINNGTINLGIEKGDSKYTNNYGLYAAGTDKTREIELVNKGTINVNSINSVAIMNEFSGSVDLINDGVIYLSNKATNSKVFGGNFSKATNNSSIMYKVGNSESFSYPELSEISYPDGTVGYEDPIALTIKNAPVGSVVEIASDATKAKQTFDNNGNIVIGDEKKIDVDYGGTFGTAAVKVSNQGSAFNYGEIKLVKYEEDTDQYNTGLYLDSSATAESYVESYGLIDVDAHYSIGIRNDSVPGAVARNFGIINADGLYSVGMAATQVNATVSNGSYNNNANANINVNASGAAGFYLNNGKAYNYGTINLNTSGTRAFYVSGKKAQILEHGTIWYNRDVEDIIFYVVTNGASLEFDDLTANVDTYTFAKALTGAQGVGSVIWGANSKAYVSGANARLFVAEGDGATATNKGEITVTGSGIGIDVLKGGKVNVTGSSAKITVDGGNAIGIQSADEGTLVNVFAGAVLDISNKGTGILTKEYSKSENYGTINVNSEGVGIRVEEGTPSKTSKSINHGTINVVGAKTKGIVANPGTEVENVGDINISSNKLSGKDDPSNYAVGIWTEGTVKNYSDGNSKGYIVVGNNAIGVYTSKLNVINDTGRELDNIPGGITVNGNNAIGVWGSLKNGTSGLLSVVNGIGVKGSIDNEGEVNVSGGTGIVGSAFNSGLIEITSDGVGIEGRVENTGEIDSRTSNEKGGLYITQASSNSGTIEGSGTIIKVADGGTFRNDSKIDTNNAIIRIEGNGSFNNLGDVTNTKFVIDNLGKLNNTGQIVSDSGTVAEVSGTFDNSGSISVGSGTAVVVKNGGYFSNSGTIEVATGSAVRVESGGNGINNSEIVLAGSGTAIRVESGGSFTNAGTISYNSKVNGHCSSGSMTNSGECKDVSAEEEEKETESVRFDFDDLIMVDDSAEFVNKGNVDLDGVDMDFGNSDKYVIAKGGTYKADTFKGEIKASSDIVMGSFYNIYTNKNSFVGKDEGIVVSSDSYMFDASLEKNEEDNVDVKLERKSFDELLEDKELADFFETNYVLENNLAMYDSLKKASNKKEFSNVTNQETGKGFYANLARENMAVIRILNDQKQNDVLNNGVLYSGVGANYYRTSKNGVDGLSDYEDDIFSANIGTGKALSKNLSVGANLTGAFVKSSYGDVNSERENKIIMAFLPIMYKNNNYKHVMMPSMGVGFGSYERSAPSGKYDADTFDIYYGLYNHSEYDVDLKVMELVLEAELNLQGISSDDADENNGLTLKANDSLSMEAGIGIKLRKQIELAKNRSLMLAIGTKYYHEFLDPYEELKVGINNSYFTNKGYEEDKNRLKTTAEALYKDGDLAISAQITHNKEKESNVEGGVGVRYSF